MTTQRTQTVLYEAPSGDKTIAATVARAMRYIDKTCDHWGGTAEEFREWARNTMKGTLERVACELVCHTPNENVGRAATVFYADERADR